MKLYKFRPLNDFLFKELYYQEIYFSTYSELNDPFDLSARIEFSPFTIDEIDYLISFIIKNSFQFDIENGVMKGRENNIALSEFYGNGNAYQKFKIDLFEKISFFKKEKDHVWWGDIFSILNTFSELPFTIDYNAIKEKIDDLTRKFLANSYVSCYSEVNNDFLLWSHYATKHSGICLEFEIGEKEHFPFIQKIPGSHVEVGYHNKMSKWETTEFMYWQKIYQVNYQAEQTFINFFEFGLVFENEHDADLIGLSKPWTHAFANKLNHVFSVKTFPWSYEKEWRTIEINFGEAKEPEERIRHYPIECLTGVYFGARTPENVKLRIRKLFRLQKSIKFFESVLTSGRILEFVEHVEKE